MMVMNTSLYNAVNHELVTAYQEDKSLTQFQNLISAHQYFRLYDTIAKYVSKGDTVLDWGSGNGHFSYFLARSGYITAGYSFDEMPKVCRGLSGELYTHQQASIDEPIRLPYKDRSFDAVASVGVLEHVRESGGDEVGSLHEIHRLLRPCGVFICYHLPNRYSWIEWALRRLGRWSHQYRYTRSDIAGLTSAAGLRLIEIERYAILPRNIWSWANIRKLTFSSELARAYDHVDTVLGFLASPVCQSYSFVAQRPER